MFLPERLCSWDKEEKYIHTYMCVCVCVFIHPFLENYFWVRYLYNVHFTGFHELHKNKCEHHLKKQYKENK